jgi:hypothetical protein
MVGAAACLSSDSAGWWRQQTSFTSHHEITAVHKTIIATFKTEAD